MSASGHIAGDHPDNLLYDQVFDTHLKIKYLYEIVSTGVQSELQWLDLEVWHDAKRNFNYK